MPIETMQEFSERHAKHGHPVRVGGVLLFGDGAQMELQSWTPGRHAMAEPPADEETRLRFIVEYRRARLDLAKETFKEAKNNLLGKSFNTPQWRVELWGARPSPDPEVCLLALQKLVAREREQLQAAEKEYENLPAVQHRRAAEQAAERERQRKADAEREHRERVQAISI